jgi:predicted outer membrane protein
MEKDITEKDILDAMINTITDPSESTSLSSLENDIAEDLAENQMQLDFDRIANEAKVATQEAISKSTIKAYNRYLHSHLFRI